MFTTTLTSIFLTCLGILMLLFVWVLIIAGSANTTPPFTAQLNRLNIATITLLLLVILGVPTSLILRQPPITLTLSAISLISPLILFLLLQELSNRNLEKLPPISLTTLIIRSLVLLVLGGSGLIMFYIGAREWIISRTLLTTATPITAEIIDSRVITSITRDTDSDVRPLHNNSTSSQRPHILFRYTFNNITYESDLITPSDIRQLSANASSAAEQILPFPIGAKVTAFVSPQYPHKAFLLKESSSGPVVFIILGALLPLIAYLAGRLI